MPAPASSVRVRARSPVTGVRSVHGPSQVEIVQDVEFTRVQLRYPLPFPA